MYVRLIQTGDIISNNIFKTNATTNNIIWKRPAGMPAQNKRFGAHLPLLDDFRHRFMLYKDNMRANYTASCPWKEDAEGLAAEWAVLSTNAPHAAAVHRTNPKKWKRLEGMPAQNERLGVI